MTIDPAAWEARAVATAQELKDSVEQMLKRANAPDSTKRYEEMHSFATRVADATAPLLDDPISATTRAHQDRMLISSAILLVVSLGVVSPSELTLGAVKFKDLSQIAALVSAASATIYFLSCFLLGRAQDIRAREAKDLPAILQMEALTDEYYRIYGEKLSNQVAVADRMLQEFESARVLRQQREEAISDVRRQQESGKAPTQESMDRVIELDIALPPISLDELEKATSERKLLETRLNAIFGVVASSKKLFTSRRRADLYLPILVVAIAVLAAGVQVGAIVKKATGPSADVRPKVATHGSIADPTPVREGA